MHISRRLSQVEESSTLVLNARASELSKAGHDVINLTVGEPDQPLPEFVKRAMIAALEQGFHKYGPTAGDPEFKKAIAGSYKRHHGMELDPAGFVISNGAKQSIFNALMAALDPGDSALMIAPYWLSYPAMIRTCEANPETWDLKKPGCPKAKALIINYPCNPSGSTFSEQELRAIAARYFTANPEGIIISDEIYSPLTFNGNHVPLLQLFPDRAKQIVLVNGLSKSFSMTGHRIGYAYYADAKYRAKVVALQSHSTSGINVVAQKGAIAAMNQGDGYIDELHEVYVARAKFCHSRLLEAIPELAGQVPEPAGAFYLWFPAPKPFQGKAREFCEAVLNEAHVALVPGDDFGDPGRVRASFACDPKRFDAALERVSALLNKRG